VAPAEPLPANPAPVFVTSASQHATPQTTTQTTTTSDSEQTSRYEQLCKKCQYTFYSLYP